MTNNECRLLHDMNYYLETRGLRENHDASLSLNNVSESRRRVAEAVAHQDQVHRRIFGKDDTEREQLRRQFLDSLKGMEIVFKTEQGTITADLGTVAESCDAVYIMANASNMYGEQKGEDRLEMSLDEYTKQEVEFFLAMATRRKVFADVSPDNVVACCEIAHFLQCSHVLDGMVEILMNSIDTANCLSIVQLADRLQLSTLFERALQHMMDSLSDIERHEVWNDLSAELRDRLKTIQNAIRSNVLSNGNKRLYFASIEEYLAILQESIGYSRERLVEAKARQTEVQRNTSGWKYAQKQIESQECRVQRLEAVLTKHRRLFTENKSRPPEKVGSASGEEVDLRQRCT